MDVFFHFQRAVRQYLGNDELITPLFTLTIVDLVSEWGLHDDESAERVEEIRASLHQQMKEEFEKEHQEHGVGEGA